MPENKYAQNFSSFAKSKCAKISMNNVHLTLPQLSHITLQGRNLGGDLWLHRHHDPQVSYLAYFVEPEFLWSWLETIWWEMKGSSPTNHTHTFLCNLAPKPIKLHLLTFWNPFWGFNSWKSLIYLAWCERKVVWLLHKTDFSLSSSAFSKTIMLLYNWSEEATKAATSDPKFYFRCPRGIPGNTRNKDKYQ